MTFGSVWLCGVPWPPCTHRGANARFRHRVQPRSAQQSRGLDVTFTHEEQPPTPTEDRMQTRTWHRPNIPPLPELIHQCRRQSVWCCLSGWDGFSEWPDGSDSLRWPAKPIANCATVRHCIRFGLEFAPDDVSSGEALQCKHWWHNLLPAISSQMYPDTRR